MKVALVYPPRAYPFMPYLAPFLLKGYLECHSHHRVTTMDLNIEYHRMLWGPNFGASASRAFATAGLRSDALVAEMLAARGEASVAALRCASTYDDLQAVRLHSLLIGEAERLERLWNRLRGVPGDLPNALGQWQTWLDRWQRSVVAGFLHDQVQTGRFDGVDVVGLTVAYVSQLVPALLCARFIKARRPDCHVVVGGNAITHFLSEMCTDHSFWPDIDAAVPFEGEVSFLEVLDSLERDEPLPRENVLYRQAGAIHYEPALCGRPRVQAEPDFSDLVHLYPTPSPIYPLLTSKGCYWGKCGFCTHHEGYGQGYQPFGDDMVSGAIERLYERGARHFYFVDEALPPKTITRLAHLFRLLHRPGDMPVRWTAEARLEKQMSEPYAVEMLRQSGCHLLVNGIESGCQQVVDAMQKGIDLERVAAFARECARVGIRTGWMFFIGFPGETPAQARMTFEFIKRNMQHVTYVSVGSFKLQRGSPVWEHKERYGLTAILDAQKAYPLQFDYVMADGRTYSTEQRKLLLSELRREYPELQSLFANALDRAFALFLPPASSNAVAPSADSTGGQTTWHSELLGAPVRFDLAKRHMEVLEHA